MITSPIFRNTILKYDWEPILPNLSLKNSYTFYYNGVKYIAATDMIRGGSVILKETISGEIIEYMHMFPNYTMMWSPHPVVIDGKVWVYCCDTAGGDLSHWWDFMRIYRHEVDLENKTYGKLIPVNIFEDDCGLIDPCLFRIGDWWYIAYAKLWDEKDNQWWDPHYSVSKSPFGPFKEEINLKVKDRGIDEAPKIFMGADRQMYCTWASGDSGIDGCAFFGKVEANSQDSEGWLELKFEYISTIKATDSLLCTALDPGGWPDLIATLTFSGYKEGEMRKNFYIGKLK